MEVFSLTHKTKNPAEITCEKDIDYTRITFKTKYIALDKKFFNFFNFGSRLCSEDLSPLSPSSSVFLGPQKLQFHRKSEGRATDLSG